jgi:hypothetical protein
MRQYPEDRRGWLNQQAPLIRSKIPAVHINPWSPDKPLTGSQTAA